MRSLELHDTVSGRLSWNKPSLIPGGIYRPFSSFQERDFVFQSDEIGFAAKQERNG